MTCLLCGNETHTRFDAYENMFGLRERFTYLQCEACNSLQIDPIPSPEIISRYYPEDYWFTKPRRKAPFVRAQKMAYGLIAPWLLGLFPELGRDIGRRGPKNTMGVALWYGIKPTDRVLDVGCGSGNFIHNLADIGIVEPVGVDPFVDSDINYSNGTRVIKSSLDVLDEGVFDVITFHHSLEHVPDPAATLRAASARLKPGGRCLVRIPTSSSEAFEAYRENWVQLDAPRHLFIPSREGMKIVGERSGLKMEAISDDSSAFQFWASEQYKRGIALRDPTSYLMSKQYGLFTDAEIAAFEARAKAANARGRGDQAIFYFRK